MSDNTDKLDLYKIADENHRFYVDKRFTVISFYFPAITLIASGLFAFSPKPFRPVAAVAGIVVTLFLYLLEYRNWILSNTCLHNAKGMGEGLNGEQNLHVQLTKSYSTDLPEGSTCLDRLCKRCADRRKWWISQHATVSALTCFLVAYWTVLAVVGFFM
jgi:hypothetical protein